MIPFLVSILGMYSILFKPMLAYLSAREAATVGARAEAQALQERLALQMADYDARITEIQRELREAQAVRRAAALARHSAAVAQARKEADVRIEAALIEVAAEQEQARTALGRQAQALADAISGRILTSLAG